MAPGRPAVEPPAEPVELAAPRQHDWDETPQEAARWDRYYFDRDEE